MKSSMQDVTCPLGCHAADEVVVVGRDILHNLPGEFTVVKCQACGLLRTNPRLTPDSIGKYYPDDYGPYVGTRVRDARQETVTKFRKLLKLIFRRIYNSNITNLPVMVPGRLLEIGCASGSFLHHMAGQGWQVQGIEFSEKAAKEASQLGYLVHTGPLETAPKPDEAFDLIVGWMVLEHLYDPVGSLKKLREWSKPTSWLALSVPNAGSLEFRLFKDKWYALQLPTHFHHFTPVTIEKVLSAGGWKLEKVYHQRVLNNLIVSTGYVLRDRGYTSLGQRFINFPAHAGRLMYFLYPLAWLLSFFGQTGRMTIWATPLNNEEEI
jgi:2-polyprenyl-3-methyl-5-hydroxy-6-metoxy-1,4-benzoquinol methylase